MMLVLIVIVTLLGLAACFWFAPPVPTMVEQTPELGWRDPYDPKSRDVEW